MYPFSLASDFFVSSSLHEDSDSDTYVTISSSPTTIEFVDTVIDRKFVLNSMLIENSAVGEVKFTINDDNSVYVMAASSTETINYLPIRKIIMLTTGKIRWKGLAHIHYPVV